MGGGSGVGMGLGITVVLTVAAKTAALVAIFTVNFAGGEPEAADEAATAPVTLGVGDGILVGSVLTASPWTATACFFGARAGTTIASITIRAITAICKVRPISSLFPDYTLKFPLYILTPGEMLIKLAPPKTMGELPTKQKIDTAILLLAAASLFAAWLVDTVLPPSVVIATLYTIPILIVAYRFGSRTITAITLATILVYSLQALAENNSVINIALKDLGFAFVAFLAVELVVQRQRAEQSARETETAKNNLQIFLNMVAHDLLQPLTAAMLYTADLYKQYPREIPVVRVREELERLRVLISDLRDAAKIHNGKFTIRPEPVDCSALLTKVVAGQKLADKKRRLLLQSPPGLVGNWDKERLSQLFDNLISNALKYSPAGGPVKITARYRQNFLLVSVKDWGLGLTPEQQKELFQPFSRLHLEQKKIAGTGLGLFISKSIVEAHAGQIWAKSRRGHGSTFFVKLPLRPPVGREN